MLLLLQMTPYQAGEAVGRALGPCCCLGFFLGLGGALVGAIVFFVRRSSAASAAPGAPPPSHNAWSSGRQQDFAAMQAAQQQLSTHLAPNQRPESEAINEAARKLVAQDFDGAIAAYEDVERRFPHRAADAHGQIGAAWFFKADYDRALFHYRRAIELGADPRMMDDNIREAEEAKRKRGR